MFKKQNIRVTKKFTFDMAHALYGYDGPCKNIHGHTYTLSITLIGKPIENVQNPKNGMVIDFSDFKNIVKKNFVDLFDHSLVLNANSPHSEIRDLKTNFEKINFVAFQPTCENLLIHVLEKIKPNLPSEIEICSIRLEETPSSYAEWFSEDNL